eukprot:4116011-Pyramimonas_sp.AAC.1
MGRYGCAARSTTASICWGARRRPCAPGSWLCVGKDRMGGSENVAPVSGPALRTVEGPLVPLEDGRGLPGHGAPFWQFAWSRNGSILWRGKLSTADEGSAAAIAEGASWHGLLFWSALGTCRG